MKNKYWYILGVAIILVVIAVLVINKERNKNPLAVDVSDIELEICIERFDHDLFNETLSLEERVKLLESKYGVFFELFNMYIIRIGIPSDPAYFQSLETFLNDYAVKKSQNAVDSVFSNVDELTDKLNAGFKHYKYYFPKEEIPRIITFVAGFNQSIVTYDSLIGIGLDKYLGKDNYLYEMMQIPDFAQFVMDEKYIPIDCMKAWASMKFPYNDSADNLLNRMVYEGQIMYFVEAMFPEYSDEIRMAYTHDQLLYCTTHERDMWAYLIENKLLFTSDYLRIKNFVDEAPFTKDFGNDSPPRIGVWIGWQIVRSFMDNTNSSLNELMNINAYQSILNLSQYDP
jgi:hypothetical protein